VDRNRDTAAVVLYADPAIFSDGDIYGVAVACKSFVNLVVHDFIDEVVKTTGTGGADVHTWALAHRFKTFENLDISGFVASVSALGVL
jgi:hypothetical protein